MSEIFVRRDGEDIVFLVPKDQKNLTEKRSLDSDQASDQDDENGLDGFEYEEWFGDLFDKFDIDYNHRAIRKLEADLQNEELDALLHPERGTPTADNAIWLVAYITARSEMRGHRGGMEEVEKTIKEEVPFNPGDGLTKTQYLDEIDDVLADAEDLCWQYDGCFESYYKFEL